MDEMYLFPVKIDYCSEDFLGGSCGSSVGFNDGCSGFFQSSENDDNGGWDGESIGVWFGYGRGNGEGWEE